MLGKKGMSPLIVTILLIAFAVALGTMIMNWSSDIASASQVSCEEIKLNVKEAFDKEILCTIMEEDQLKLKIALVNEGKSPIDFITFRRVFEDLSIKNIKVPGSSMGSGATKEIKIPFVSATKVHIEFIPGIIKSGQDVLCTEQAIVKENIPSC